MRPQIKEPIPAPHGALLEQVVQRMAQDERLLGVAICGSYLTKEMDEYSDLDLVVVVQDRYYDEVLEQRQNIAASLGELLASFSGEHVGEPRLLICLYANPLLHVDLKFVRLDSFPTNRVENPAVLWERGACLSEAAARNPSAETSLDAQWIEDRFWTWVHYAACKLGRGELFEALSAFPFLRSRVFGPMAKANAGLRPHEVRHLERDVPEMVPAFRETIASTHDAKEIARALFASVRLYRQLRDQMTSAHIAPNQKAEEAAMQFLGEVVEKIGGSSLLR